MVRRIRFAPLLTALLACGIAPARYGLVATSPAPLSPRSGPCDFRVVAIVPPGPYEEIATLTPDGGELAMDPEDFGRRVHDDVCGIGGEVVVAQINGAGGYVRGTVLRPSDKP
jgi:hypothetical protein